MRSVDMRNCVLHFVRAHAGRQLVARPAADSATRRALSVSEMSSTRDMIDQRTPKGSRIEAWRGAPGTVDGLTDSPGTARWLRLHGPVFPGAAPVVDSGIASLQQAGFGRHTALAYSSLVNTAMMTITTMDDRRLHKDDGPHDHATLMRSLSGVATDSTGISLLMSDNPDESHMT